MPNPNDYSLNVPDPSQAFTQGLQSGFGIQETQLKLQQQQQAVAAQQQQQKAMQAFIAKPDKTADDYAHMTLLVPGMREQFKQSWDMKNTDQQQAALQHIGEVGSALTFGKPDVAIKILTDRATALQNSGADQKEIKAAQDMAELVKTNPTMAAGLVQAKLGAIPNGDKVLANIKAIGTMPGDVRKVNADASGAESEAIIKGVQAAAAPTTTALGNQKTAQEIAKSQADAKVAQFNADIAAANSETERGRLTLERDKYVQEQAKLNQTQGVAAQDGMDSLTNAMQSVNDIKNHRGVDGWFTGPGTSWGAIWRAVPGSARHDLETYIDTLKSQLGYGSLMAAKASSPTGASGFGALSESELKVISQQAANLDPNSKDFPAQLSKVERFLQKAQAKAVASPQLPTKGGAYVATVPGIGTVDEGHINQVLKANPGSTRDQVIKFLQSVGGK